MHLLIPFAGVESDACRLAGKSLVLPHLQALLQRLEPEPDGGGQGAGAGHDPPTGLQAVDGLSLTPPHEAALANAMGLQGGPGLLPWAALQAQADGLETMGKSWGLVTPVHWHVGTDQVSLIDPAQLMLDDRTSRALFAAVQDLFTGLGFEFFYGRHDRWYAAHNSLATLPCASLDRVIGRNVDRWLGGHETPGAANIRRLQAEVQMVLYTHPVNDQRQARGLLPVNSFWLSGCGVTQTPSNAVVQVDPRLRAPALTDDGAAWGKAWATLDDGPLAALSLAVQQGQPVRLTLCGERRYLNLHSAGRSWAQRLLRTWRSPAVQPLLAGL